MERESMILWRMRSWICGVSDGRGDVSLALELGFELPVSGPSFALQSVTQDHMNAVLTERGQIPTDVQRSKDLAAVALH